MAAGDKYSRTEKATPKRRREARERGQVARSPDLGGAAALLLGSFLIPTIFSRSESQVVAVFANCMRVVAHPTVAAATLAFTDALRGTFFLVLTTASAFLALGVGANVAQVGLKLSLKAARPKFSHVNPRDGLKRIFSPTTTISLARQSGKLLFVAVLGYQTVHTLATTIPSAVPVGIAQTIGMGTNSLLGFVRSSALLTFLIGAGDFAYQRHKLLKGLKMTKQEVKDEARASEGDPHMKAEIRKRGYAIARSRTLGAVRAADVVVTNPTHFAVALEYRASGNGAPRVVAKGADLLAKRMREEAATYGVPVVEDPPLTRYLYASCEIGQAIPAEIYLAVAKLLAFVYALPEVARGARVHFHPPTTLPDNPGTPATRRRVAALLGRPSP